MTYLRAQGPGNVTTSLELWLKANAGVTVSGSDVTTWADQANSNDLSQVTTGNQPDLISNGLNSYEVIEFDGTDDWLDRAGILTAGDDTHSFIVVWETDVQQVSAVIEQNSTTITTGARSALRTINSASNNYGYNGESNDADDILSYSINVPQISSIVLDGTSTVTGYHNGASNTGTINETTQVVGTDAFTIGRRGSGNDEFFNGTIAEIIVYSVDLAASDRQRIESYLALKYGITLDQTSATDYIASDGTTEMWDKDATDASTYDNDIAGVGRDDNSVLSQIISKSINANAIVTMEAEGEGTNSAPTFVDIGNLEFLTWGHNAGAATWTSTDAPNSYQILSKEWSVQETGDVGTVEVSFDVEDADFDVPSLLSGTSYYLIIDTDNDGNFNDESPVLLYDDGTNGDDTADDNVWTAQSIDFDSGEDFTLATAARYPGNVSTNLELWLKANADLTGSSPVTSWADQSGNALDATAVNSPTLVTDGLNFNPTVGFDGTSARFTTAVTQLFSTNTSPVSIITVFDTDASEGEKFLFMQDHTSGTDNVELGYDTGAGTGSGNYGLGVGSLNATIVPASTIADNTFNIMSSLILNTGNSPLNINIFQNGESLTPSDNNSGFVNAGSYNTGSSIVNIGARDTGTPDGFHDGDIAEMIVYTQQLSSTDRQKIESYLAVKYGIAIDQTSATDYLASDGGIIWNGTTNAAYNTDIAGIGRDDNSDLDQQKSGSVNSNAILTVANGDITTPSSFSADDSWLIWGHDDGAITFGSGNINNADGTTSNRMTRVWKVQETGTVGSVEIAIPNSVTTGTVSIVIDPADNTFANNADRRIIEMVDSGSDYEVTVDLVDGEFFSFVNAAASAIATKPVLINEVIVTPRQDWSSGNFYDAAPGGSGGADDEWVELYIASDGLDLTGWTIELNDGTNESGTLAAGGAFVHSNYLSTSGGSFTNTVTGDYLILGSMSSGAINEIGTTTVNLKNGSGDIIDQVVISNSSGTGFNGSSTDATDESISRIPSGTDTNVNATDFSKTRATLGTTNSPSGVVKINEVVTDPQQDWSTTSFNGVDGMSTVSDVDEWIELYIGTAGVNLTGWTIEMTDGTDESGELTTSGGGAFGTVNYITSGSGTFINTEVGDYVVLGNPTGAINNDVLIILYDASGTEIDRVQLGGGSGQAPDGNAISTSDESVVRYTNATDTDADDADFIQTISTIGSSNSLSGTVLINEVVTDPQQDWSTNGFDGTVAGGTVDTDDEWVELYMGTAGINLTNWSIELTDGTNVTGDLTTTGAFEISNYISNTAGSSFLSTAVGDYLVLGNVNGADINEDDILITLRDATGTLIDEVELGDDPASDGAGDGAPDGSANGGDATGAADESISRILNATDTDNDINDFSETPASLGTTNSFTPLAGVGNGLDFGGTNEHVDFSSPILTATDNLTLEAWVNPDAFSGTTFAVYNGTIATDGYGISFDASGNIGITTGSSGSVVSSSAVSTAAWSHIAAVRNAGTWELYVNGVEIAITFTQTPVIPSATAAIGSDDTGSQAFDGQIDEARFWSAALTHEEILEAMNSVLNGSEINLDAYYNFDQSSGTSLPDLVASNDGTLTNMTGSEWTVAGWNTFSQNAAILRTGGANTTPATSGELTLTNVDFLNDDNDILLAGHENSDFVEVNTDLPAGTLITARYNRNWHMTKNDAAGTTDGVVTLAFDLGSVPDTDITYYLLERASTSGDFSIVPVDGVNPGGTSIVFTVNTSQIDDGSYYTAGRSDAGVGNSLDFDGSVDYVTIEDDDVFSFGDGTNDSPFSIEAWVYFDATASQGIVSKCVGGLDEWHMALSGSGQLSIALADDSQNAFLFGETSGISLSTGQWYHLAFTYDASETAAGISLYVDGVQLTNNSSSSGTYIAMENTSSAVEIGTINSSTSFDLNGQTDELRIWNDVRTHSEIVTSMFSNLAGDESNLVGYYRFNQGIGNSDTNLPDLSGGNNNGTLTNFANLGGVTTPSNYLAATRDAFSGIALIVNGGTLSAASDELTLTSTQTSGDFLQDAGDQIIWGNDGGAFTETTADVPTATTLVTNRITKTWNIDKNDVVGTADGNVTFSFDLGTTPNKDVTYYLLTRTGTSGDFSVVQVIDSSPNGNSIEFTVDGAQITDENYFTLGRSGTGAGNGVDLDGTDDYVLISDANSLDITGTLTLEAWINLGTAPGGDEGIVAKFLTGTEESYSLDINSLRNVEFKVTSDGFTPIEVTSASTIPTGTWTHIAAVYTPNTSLQIYIDGVLNAENTSGIPVSLHPGTADLWIGSTSAVGVANNHLDALIDEVRIWNVARSKADILGDIHNNLTGNETGLVAYYRFNQGDAENTNTGLDVVPDRSGNGNSGTLTNLALSGASSNWVDSDALVVTESSSQSLLGPGNALDFDGTDDHVLVSDNATLESSSTLTVEAWLRPTSVASRQSAVSRYFTNPDASNVFLLDISASAVLAFTVNESDNNLVSASTTIAANTWTHVAGVADGTNVHIYVNGILEASTSYDGTITSNSTRSLVIGRTRQEDSDGPFVGQIDEVRIWNTARTATQIQDNMYEELTGSETGLVAYYQFDELTNATTVPDESANSNTGTLTNMDAATDWVDAAAREPFKTVSSGTWNTVNTDLWKSAIVPNASTADLNVSHNIALDDNLSVDDLNINSGVTLTLNNTQTLTISGNLINNGTITGAGTLSFAGAAAQNLTAGTYSNVTLNNTADEITLAGNATFTGTLTLTNGNLVLGTNNLIINSGGAISGGGALSYVQTINQNSSGGTLQMEVANGAGPVTFPIGTSTYTPFTMVNLGTTGDFNLRVFDGTYEDGTSGAAHSSTEEINRTWDVNALGSGYNTTITIQWNVGEEDVGFTRNSMFISLNDATGAWIAATGTISASGTNPYTASASGITSFSQVGGGSGSSPLPVTLMNFNASVVENEIMLDWQTATEINNHRFEVERSHDGSVFSMIGTVEGVGNSNEIVSYAFADRSPRNGINYYRLRQVDYDGSYEYSPTVAVVYEPFGELFTVFPNPFSDELMIKMNQEVNGLTQLSIYNLTGEIIRSFETQLSGQLVLRNLNLKSGIYFLEINHNGQIVRSKIVRD